MTDVSNLVAGVKVRLKNPTRNTERNALARFGDVWVVMNGSRGPVVHGDVLVGSLERDVRGIPVDARWWRIEDVEVVS